MNAAYIKPIIYFCNKILPAVYDESLSYYEALCKMRDKLNEVIDNVNNVNEHIDDVINQRLTDEHLREIFHSFIVDIEAAICANNELDNTNSSEDYNVGTFLWLNDKLYRAIRNIDAGDTFIVDTNIELVNFADIFAEFITNVKKNFTANDDGDNTIASQDWEVGQWLWLHNQLYVVTKDISEGTGYIYTGANQNVEEIDMETITNIVYYPNDKGMTLFANVSDYHEIVYAGDYHIYNPRVEAIEIKKVE